jgi:hypothetical protein
LDVLFERLILFGSAALSLLYLVEMVMCLC